MPRFTRNAYIVGSADGVSSGFSTGPRERGGWLEASVTLRTAGGEVSEPVKLTAGGLEHGTGAAHAFITVPPSMSVTVHRLPSGATELHVIQTPAEAPRVCPSGTPLDVTVRGHHCDAPHA